MIFTEKYKLSETEQNKHSSLEHLGNTEPLPDNFSVSAEDATRVLNELREESGTGPDALATRLLKNCSKTLGKPVAELISLLLDAGCLPRLWHTH